MFIDNSNPGISNSYLTAPVTHSEAVEEEIQDEEGIDFSKIPGLKYKVVILSDRVSFKDLEFEPDTVYLKKIDEKRGAFILREYNSNLSHIDRAFFFNQEELEAITTSNNWFSRTFKRQKLVRIFDRNILYKILQLSDQLRLRNDVFKNHYLNKAGWKWNSFKSFLFFTNLLLNVNDEEIHLTPDKRNMIKNLICNIYINPNSLTKQESDLALLLYKCNPIYDNLIHHYYGANRLILNLIISLINNSDKQIVCILKQIVEEFIPSTFIFEDEITKEALATKEALEGIFIRILVLLSLFEKCDLINKFKPEFQNILPDLTINYIYIEISDFFTHEMFSEKVIRNLCLISLYSDQVLKTHKILKLFLPELIDTYPNNETSDKLLVNSLIYAKNNELKLLSKIISSAAKTRREVFFENLRKVCSDIAPDFLSSLPLCENGMSILDCAVNAKNYPVISWIRKHREELGENGKYIKTKRASIEEYKTSLNINNSLKGFKIFHPEEYKIIEKLSLELCEKLRCGKEPQQFFQWALLRNDPFMKEVKQFKKETKRNKIYTFSSATPLSLNESNEKEIIIPNRFFLILSLDRSLQDIHWEKWPESMDDEITRSLWNNLNPRILNGLRTWSEFVPSIRRLETPVIHSRPIHPAIPSRPTRSASVEPQPLSEVQEQSSSSDISFSPSPFPTEAFISLLKLSSDLDLAAMLKTAFSPNKDTSPFSFFKNLLVTRIIKLDDSFRTQAKNFPIVQTLKKLIFVTFNQGTQAFSKALEALKKIQSYHDVLSKLNIDQKLIYLIQDSNLRDFLTNPDHEPSREQLVALCASTGIKGLDYEALKSIFTLIADLQTTFNNLESDVKDQIVDLNTLAIYLLKGDRSKILDLIRKSLDIAEKLEPLIQSFLKELPEYLQPALQDANALQKERLQIQKKHQATKTLKKRFTVIDVEYFIKPLIEKDKPAFFLNSPAGEALINKQWIKSHFVSEETESKWGEISCHFKQLYFDGYNFDNCTFTNFSFENGYFENCTFEHVLFKGVVKLTGVRMDSKSASSFFKALTRSEIHQKEQKAPFKVEGKIILFGFHHEKEGKLTVYGDKKNWVNRSHVRWVRFEEFPPIINLQEPHIKEIAEKTGCDLSNQNNFVSKDPWQGDITSLIPKQPSPEVVESVGSILRRSSRSIRKRKNLKKTDDSKNILKELEKVKEQIHILGIATEDLNERSEIHNSAIKILDTLTRDLNSYYQEKKSIKRAQEALLRHENPSVRTFYKKCQTHLGGHFQVLFLLCNELGLLDSEVGKLTSHVMQGGILPSHDTSPEIEEARAAKEAGYLPWFAHHFPKKIKETTRLLLQVTERALYCTKQILRAKELIKAIPVVGETIEVAIEPAAKVVDLALQGDEYLRKWYYQDQFDIMTPKRLEKLAEAISRRLTESYMDSIQRLDVNGAKTLAGCGAKRVILALLNGQVNNKQDFISEVLFAVRSYSVSQNTVCYIPNPFGFEFLESNLSVKKGLKFTEADVFQRSGIFYRNNGGIPQCWSNKETREDIVGYMEVTRKEFEWFYNGNYDPDETDPQVLPSKKPIKQAPKNSVGSTNQLISEVSKEQFDLLRKELLKQKNVNEKLRKKVEDLIILLDDSSDPKNNQGSCSKSSKLASNIHKGIKPLKSNSKNRSRPRTSKPASSVNKGVKPLKNNQGRHSRTAKSASNANTGTKRKKVLKKEKELV